MKESENTITELAAIIATAQQPQGGGYSTPGDIRPYVIVPAGHEVRGLPQADRPTYPLGCAAMQSVESFIHYINRFKTNQTAAALNTDTAAFTAKLDYHYVNKEGPAFGERQHVCSLALIHSDAWKFWAKHHDQWISQEDVVGLFEERAADIANPSLADLLKVAVDFKSTSSEEYTTRYNRLTQQTELVVKMEENKRGGDVVIPPDSITLRIPVFKHGPAVELTALFSWKGKAGQFVKLRFLDLTKAKDEAMEHERMTIATATGLPVLLGALA